MIKILEHLLYAATIMPVCVGWFWDFWNYNFYFEFFTMIAIMSVISFLIGKFFDYINTGVKK